MKQILYWIALLTAAQSYSAYEVGQKVEDKCWPAVLNESDAVERRFCLSDRPGTVRVLIFGAGWCGACNDEMKELVPRLAEIPDPNIVFISIVSAGKTRQAKPDVTFMKEWKKKFGIPFPVAASPRDSGRDFFEAPIYIPNAVVLDRRQRVAYKAIAPSISELFAEIRSATLLGE